MIAIDVETGQFFTLVSGNGDVLQRIPNSMGTDGWERSAGVLCINTKTGAFVGLGGANLVELAYCPDNPRREMILADVVKLVERAYEFGVGGLSQADDPYYATSQYQPTGEKRPKLVGRGLKRGPMPNGCRYDEDCELCRRTTVVCNDCGYCEKHCTCGD